MPAYSNATFHLNFIGYTNANCSGVPAYNKTYLEGSCIDLPLTTLSWKSTNHPPSAQEEMLVYAKKDCKGPGGVEHLDADGICFIPDVIIFNQSTIAKSICVGCPF
ncbi:MAG: hypothetical protein M1828_001628 [Chrysothrix sp. TS-e1954]|nr:MAG: hypothetical protein M1828_001628 [Chrysothrix sp. TS-e1954]